MRHVDVPFLEAIERGGLVGDGAMGSLLYERGVFVNRNFDEINLSQPELVYQIHREYLHSGAHVLESNTYGANRLRLARHGLEGQLRAINEAGVSVLRRACADAAYVAGSVGPTGYHGEEVTSEAAAISKAFVEQASILAQAGCDLLVIETFHDLSELRLAVCAVRSAVPLPIIAQVAPTPTGGLPGDIDPVELAHQLRSWGADVVGVNCSGPAAILQIASNMVESGLPICAMPNAGYPQSLEDRLIYLATPENFGVYARRLYKAGVKMVGGCCGTGPSHMTRVSAAGRMLVPRQSSVRLASTGSQQTPLREPLPVRECSPFGARLGRQFVVSVEVNPHPGLDMSAPLRAAKMLHACGADAINIADGPRATVRMSNLALAVTMQRELSIDVLLHVCCRDHNVLGLQSGLLGAHALGIRNVVIITGDPPKIGDYPDATAVYDLDSIGLIKLVHGYNGGVDPAGKAMEQTRFVIATGVEPAAVDFAREMVRLRQKVANGAHLIMTQPVYDAAQLDRFLNATADIDVPVLVGVLPLASYRNAEFIHHHIPGMSIPADIRERMRQAGTGEAARREGVKVAAEALLGVRNRVAGAYIMPPLNRYDMAAEVIALLGADRTLAAGVPGRREQAVKGVV